MNRKKKKKRSIIETDSRNFQLYELLTGFAKVYLTNYFVIETQKHHTDFFIYCHYYCLLLMTLL